MSAVPQVARQNRPLSAQQTAEVRGKLATEGVPSSTTTQILSNPQAAQSVYSQIEAQNQQPQPSPQAPNQPEAQPSEYTGTYSPSRLDYFLGTPFVQEVTSAPAYSARANPPVTRLSRQNLTAYYIGSSAERQGAFQAGQSSIPNTQNANLLSNQSFSKLSTSQQEAYLKSRQPVLENQYNILQTEQSQFYRDVQDYYAHPSVSGYYRLQGEQSALNQQATSFNTSSQIFNEQAKQVNSELSSPFARTTGESPLAATVGRIQNFFIGPTLAYENLRIALTNQGQNARNPATRGITLFAAGLSGEAAGVLNSLAFAAGRPAPISQNVASLTGEALGLGAQFYIGGEVISAGERVAGISRLPLLARIGARATYGAAIGAGSTVFTGGNPIVAGAENAALFGLGPEAVRLARPIISSAGSAIRGGLSSFYERVFLQTGVTRPSIATGERDFLQAMIDQYVSENRAQTARDIYEQTGRGVNSYTYNPPEYRSFSQPISNPYEFINEQPTTEEFNSSVRGTFRGSSPSTQDYENVSREGTITVQRQETSQDVIQQQVSEERAIEQSRQQYFQSLTQLQRARRSQRTEEQYSVLAYPAQGLKPSISLLPRQSLSESFDLGFRQELRFREALSLQFDSLSLSQNISQRQALRQSFVQEEIQVPRFSLREAFETVQEQRLKIPTPLNTVKRRKHKKGKKRTKGYKEFFNILNLEVITG